MLIAESLVSELLNNGAHGQLKVIYVDSVKYEGLKICDEMAVIQDKRSQDCYEVKYDYVGMKQGEPVHRFHNMVINTPMGRMITLKKVSL